MSVHPTAIIGRDVELGEGVEIGPYAILESGAKIGAGARIYAHAYIGSGARIGEECQIHPGAVVGHIPQDLAFRPCDSYAVIGERTVVREYAQVHRGTKPGSSTVVGPDCLLMACSHIAHDCRLGGRVILANNALLAGYVEVGERSIISGGVLVHQFVRIGRLAMLSGGSRFSMDIPPFLTAQGQNSVRAVNLIGLMRSGGFDGARVEAIREAFRRLYLSGQPAHKAAGAILADGPLPEVRELAEFILASKRGVCRCSRVAGENGEGEGEEAGENG